MKLKFPRQIFEIVIKNQISLKSAPMWATLLHYDLRDRRADRRDETKGLFFSILRARLKKRAASCHIQCSCVSYSLHNKQR